MAHWGLLSGTVRTKNTNVFCDSLLGHSDTDHQQRDISLHTGMSAANQSWNIIELEGHWGR